MMEHERRADDQAKAARRLRWLAGVLAVVGLLLVAATAVAVRMQGIAADRADSLSTAVADKIAAQGTAEAERGRADRLASTQLSQQLAAEALSRISTDLDQALLLAARAYQTADTAQARAALLRALWYEPHLLGYLTGIGPAYGTSGEVRFSADGTRIAANLSGVVGLWDVATLQLLDVLETPGLDSLDSLSIAEDDTSLTFVVPGAGNLLRPTAIGGAEEFWQETSPTGTLAAGVLASAASPDGERIGAVGCRPGGQGYDTCDLQVHLWTRAPRLQVESIGKPEEYDERPYLDRWYDQSNRLLGVTWLSSPDAELWDVKTGQQIADVELPSDVPGPFDSLAALSQQGNLVAWPTEQSIVVWDVQKDSQLLELDFPGATGIRFSPDGQLLAAGSESGAALWRLASGERLFESPGTVSDFHQLAFSGDGRAFASTDGQTITTCWLGTPDTIPECGPLWLGGINVIHIALSEDGRMLASVEYLEGTVGQLWDVSTRQRLSQLPPTWGSTGPAVFSPSHRLAILGAPGAVWDVDPGSWVDLACRVANRDLSAAEWEQVFGPGVPYQRTCPEPAPSEGALPSGFD